MTEQKEYYGPEEWQTPTDEMKVIEIAAILDGTNSPDWPRNAKIMLEQILATINEGVTDDDDP